MVINITTGGSEPPRVVSTQFVGGDGFLRIVTLEYADRFRRATIVLSLHPLFSWLATDVLLITRPLKR